MECTWYYGYVYEMNAYQDMKMLRISDLDDHCEGYGEF